MALLVVGPRINWCLMAAYAHLSPLVALAGSALKERPEANRTMSPCYHHDITAGERNILPFTPDETGKISSVFFWKLGRSESGNCLHDFLIFTI